MLVPRFYRGRLVGFAQREDHHGALRSLEQLAALPGTKRCGPDPSFEYEALGMLIRTRGVEPE